MRAKLALLAILFLGLIITGCTSKPEQKVGTAVAPALEEAETPAPEPVINEDNAEIDALIQEVQELEEFLSYVEQGDTLELSL
jgi:PBP1b-binding outer membrane lipoprotein LpoB